MLDYGVLKIMHVACVAGSYALFLVRGVWMLQGSSRLRERWVRIVPHVVDTILLASAIGMLIMLRVSPLAFGWLTAKLMALLVYIALGVIALRRGRTRRVRITAWIAAQIVFLYIVGVALTRNPLPLLS
jgi:uncharacterized membrane protein SirB2